MSIELHCPGCAKLIRAPADAGGKSGKCPYCQRKVYIPMPKEELEIIPIAPIDPQEEERDAQLRREAAEYAATIDHGTEGNPPPASSPTGGQAIDLESEVKRFVMSMHASNLDEADRIAEKLKKSGQRGKDFVQGIIVDEMPLAIENVPTALVHGFLKSLLDRMP